MKKVFFIITIIIAIASMSGCSTKLETRTDVEPLKNHLPELSIINSYWYGDVKKDVFSGVGPCTYEIYGVASIGSEFINEIKTKYTWDQVEDYYIFNLVSKLETGDYLDKDENYLRSEQFCTDISNTNVFDILVDFNNNTIVFYAEYTDF